MAASENENFALSGPSFLTAIDWSNSYHRRSVAASLVHGAYVLDNDRRLSRQALAPPWWEFFNFRLVQVLVEDGHDQSSYFGAVYEYASPFPFVGHRPPQHVIALRGKPLGGGRVEDIKLNLKCMVSNLQDTRRFQIALDSVSRVVAGGGAAGNVWLAGHSMGSSLALIVGRHVAKTLSAHLETYLFSPPFASLPIKNEKLKTGLRIANSVLTAGLAKAAASQGGAKTKENVETFAALSTWIPYLFVNQSDTVSSEYIGYFEHRQKMESIGAGKIAKLATRHSIGSIVSAARGKESEAAHLIPSGYLTVNCGPCQHFGEAHGIHQWWKPDLELKYKLHQFK